MDNHNGRNQGQMLRTFLFNLRRWSDAVDNYLLFTIMSTTSPQASKRSQHSPVVPPQSVEYSSGPRQSGLDFEHRTHQKASATPEIWNSHQNIPPPPPCS